MNIEHQNSNDSYELEDLLNAKESSNRTTGSGGPKNEKDRKGKLIVDTFLKNHHHSHRHLKTSNTVTTTATASTTPVNNSHSHGNLNGNSNHNANGNSNSQKKPKNAKKLDEYGFIVNIDEKGTIRSEDSFYVSGGASTPTLHYNAPSNPNGQDSNNSYPPNQPPGTSQEEYGFQNMNLGFGKQFPYGRKKKTKNNMNRILRRPRRNMNLTMNGSSSERRTNPNSASSYPSISKSPSDPTSNTSNHHQHTSSPTRRRQKNHKHQKTILKYQQKLSHRREKKWNQMISDYPSYLASKPKLKKVHSRVRKGIPNSMRGKAWVTMARVDEQVKAMNGVYADLVEQSCTDKLEGIHEALVPFVVKHTGDQHDDDDQQQQQQQGNGHRHNGSNEKEEHDDLQNTDTNDSNHKASNMSNHNSSVNDGTVDIMKETIERDINRTFPRHSMFYDSYSDSDDDEEDENDEEEDDDKYYDSNLDYKQSSSDGVGVGDNHEGTKSNNGKTYQPSKNNTRGDEYDEMSDESYDHVSLTGSLGSAANYSNDIAAIIQDFDALDTSGGGSTNSRNNLHPHDDDHCWTRALKNATAICPSLPYVDSKKENALVSVGGGAKAAPPLPPSSSSPTRKEKKKVDFTTEEGGQAILRRVLRAYSLYDPEVGYCQGMNFIAGMFITFVTEEEAFWLLVYVMNAKPCRMRGLFGVGMSEAHQVLYVAEQLIAQFNPKLSRHFDKENIHITMFATQWLLTMYTSSFPFHIVTRLWDCFILEGWKVAYRVMLALLEIATPDLLKLRFEDILNYFKVLPFQVNVNVLFDATFQVPLKKRHIEKYAKEWLRKQETDKMTKQLKQKRVRKKRQEK